MSPIDSRTLRLALAALTAAGCTIYDGREIAIDRLDLAPVDRVLRVHLRGSGDRARLAIDGRGLPGTFPIGEELLLDVSGLSEEEHVLEARVESGRPLPPARAPFLVYHGPPVFLGAGPPAGPREPGPLQAEFRFTKPVRLEQALLDEDGLRYAPASASISADGTTVLLALVGPPDRLEGYTRLHARVVVRDFLGARLVAEAGPWFVRRVTVAFDRPGPGDPLQVSGTIAVAPRATTYDTANPPASAQLYAGDRLVAELGPPPWQPVAWDTRGVPEGTYPLEVRVPGHFAESGRGPTVLVDRTPPVVSCAPWIWSRELLRADCIMLAFSEIVTGPPARLLRDGAPVAFRSNDVSPYPSQMLCLEGPQPEPPYTVTVDVSGLVDGAGLQAEPSGCVFPVASWNAPHGPEPLQEWGGLVRAGEVALGFSSLAWIPPPGDPEAGRLRVGRFPAFGRQPVVVLSEAGTAASQVRACGDVAVWTETAAGGGASRLAIGLGQFGSPWARRPGLEAWTGARSPTCDEMTAHLAWSEPGSQGRRGIRTALWTGTDLVPFGAEVRVDPAADADTPALSVSGMQEGAALLAFLETAPGGVPQLRLATARPSQDAGWTPLAGSLNLDPQAAASAPGVSAKWDLVVAWVEGGRVLVRRAPAGAGIADLGPPVAFPSDGVHAGRSPQVLDDGGGRPSVIYVESGPEGDRIRARRWDGASWRLVATPANDGVPGPVGALDASASPLGVAWTEADGGVRIRGANF